MNGSVGEGETGRQDVPFSDREFKDVTVRNNDYPGVSGENNILNGHVAKSMETANAGPRNADISNN